MKVKEKSILALTIFTAITLLFCLPQLCIAGSLEPIDPPGPTMKTLDLIPPAWSQQLPAAERFELVLYDKTCFDPNNPDLCVMFPKAVLDKETGLVWERSPEPLMLDWNDAIFYCYRKVLGGRKGWRLPTVEELESLVDPTVPYPGLTLPSGHPFTNVQSDYFYWSSATYDLDARYALGVYMKDIDVSMGGIFKTALQNAWCVRGGHGYDAY